MVGQVAALIDDAGKVAPLSGMFALFLIMLKMVWNNDADRRRIETQLRHEFKIEREAAEARCAAELTRKDIEHEAAIEGLKVVHAAEVESFTRRLQMFREEEAERRARKDPV